MVQDGGEKVAQLYRTQAEALEVIAEIEAAVGPADRPATLQKAIEAYEVRRRELDRKATTIATTSYRLTAIMQPALGLPLAKLTPDRCAGLYEMLRKGSAVDTHRNALAEAKTFGSWIMERKWATRNPWAGVKGEGTRKHGKPQLRIDEARRWYAVALAAAQGGELGAVGALLTAAMGLRCSEIVGLVVRDLDDGGRVLWVAAAERAGKTAAARRTLEVPDDLQPMLRLAAQKQLPGAPLLGERNRKWPLDWVQRLCRQAKVPEVCAHAMRGLYATLGVSASSAPQMVAASLGHASLATTMQSYADGATVAAAAGRRSMKVMKGGK